MTHQMEHADSQSADFANQEEHFQLRAGGKFAREKRGKGGASADNFLRGRAAERIT
jgi:hypothetical protein